jgi:hypothetical protein
MLLVAFSNLAETLYFIELLAHLTSRLAPIFGLFFSETGAGQLFARFGFWYLVFGFCKNQKPKAKNRFSNIV